MKKTQIGTKKFGIHRLWQNRHFSYLRKARLAVAALSGLVFSLMAPVAWGQTSSYYTPARIATGTTNKSQYTWGQNLWTTIHIGDGVPDYFIGTNYANINVFSAQPDDFFWFLQPETVFPRYVPPECQQVSPVTGLLLSQTYGFKAWVIDPIAHPYKILDRTDSGTTPPATAKWYPKNDFYQYYLHSIDPLTGRFSPTLAAGNGTYLINVEDNSTHFVDSGTGFNATPDNPNTGVVENVTYKICPIAIYSRFVYTAYTIPLIRSLSQAAILETDTAKKVLYARQGLILLARLAFIYPDYRAQTPDRSHWMYEAAPGAPQAGGMITDNIWETSAFEEICMGYDALRPFIYTDPDIVGYVGLKGIPASTPADLDNYIRVHLLQAGMDALQRHKIAGNLGMAQAAAMAAAVAFNDTGTTSGASPNSKDMADLVYSGFQSARYLFINGLHRDGGGQESVNYNNIKLDFVRVAELMDVLRTNFPSAFPTTTYPDFFAQEKARSLFDYFIDIAPQDRFTPDFGDSGILSAPLKIAKPGYLESANFYYAWQKYDRDPANLAKSSRYLKAAGISGTWPAGDLFEDFPEAAALTANAPLKNGTNLVLDHVAPAPRLLAGYGVGVLEQGWGDSRRTFLQNATSLMNHKQYDALSVSLYAKNLSLLPDLGYPMTWTYRYQYDSHSMAANTVTVDETRGTMASLVDNSNATLSVGPTGATGRVFGQAGPLQFVASSFNPYPAGYYKEPFRTRFETFTGTTQTAASGVTLYERMDAQIEIDSQSSYIVDLFSVNGGSQHDLSWHGPLVVPTDIPSAAMNWTTTWTSTTASLAGPSINRFSAYTDAWGRNNIGGAFPSFLNPERQGTLSGPAAWQWQTSGTGTQDGMKIFLLPVDGDLQVTRGRGCSPARAAELEYLLARHTVTGGSRTRFLSIVEPFSGTSAILSASVVSTSPLVVQVVHTSGTDRISLGSPDGSSLTTDNRNLGARLERWSLGQSGTNKSIDVQYGSSDDITSGYVSGTINYINTGTRTIRVPYTPDLDEACQVGRWVRIYNSGRSSQYEITARSSNTSYVSMTLDHTALLATGTVQSVTSSKVLLGADLEFANGRLDASGNLRLDEWQPRDFFAGAWLSSGTNARKLKGAVETGSASTNTAGSVVFFSGSESNPAAYQAALGTGDVSIWDYGIGDTVEVAKVQYGRQIAPGSALSLPVQLAPPSGTTTATIEVMAWLKYPTWAGYTPCFKAQWDGAALACTRPTSFVNNNGTTITTFNSTLGYSLPYIPDPIAITPSNPYYFQNAADVFDLTKLRFTVTNPTAGSHTLLLTHTQTGITAPIVVGAVNVSYSH